VIAVDNDVLLKAATYDTADRFWMDGGLHGLGVLGAAKYVLPSVVAKRSPRKGAQPVLAALERILAAASALEPDQEELALAASIESAAQAAAVPLDVGESQLCAIVIRRGLEMLETGDKRAIQGFERVLDVLLEIARLEGRLRCLEQIVLTAIADDDTLHMIARAVCEEPDADKTLAICFGCASRLPVDRALIEHNLRSYIETLRKTAKRVLCPG
jgi:hypothetical protein